VPVFADLFTSFGASLPTPTVIVINISNWTQANWYIVVAVAYGVKTGLGWAYKNNETAHYQMDKMILAAPVFGNILKKAAVARFARTLSTMFSAGVPLVEALQSVAGATGNIVYEKAVLAMRDEVSTGQRLQRAMENTGIFPNMVVQMIAVGEESGSLDEMSSKVADFYEADVDNAVDSMSSLLEPLIMAILGVLVGGLVIAMYLPIFKLGSVV
jgi:type IV pilus assembly protein PilC